MPTLKNRFVCACIAGLLTGATALGQWTDSGTVSPSNITDPGNNRTTLRGEIDGNDTSGLRVELRGVQQGENLQTSVLPNGSFEFSSVPAGAYELTVTDESGSVLHREVTSARGGAFLVRIRLDQAVQSPERSKGGTISLEHLRHRIPAKALKELKAARKAEVRRDPDGAMAHLNKALKIDPDCAEAWNALGARYLAAKQPDKAIESLQRALKIDPALFAARTNAAAALLALGRVEEAELAARQAVRLNGVSALGHYLLALALFSQKKYGPETLTNFQAAAGEIPRAHLAAAEVLQRMGRSDNARTELQQFMASSKPESMQPELRSKVESWIAHLKPEAAR